MDSAPKPGTGRLGRGSDASRLTLRDLRIFVRSDFTRRLAVLVAGVFATVVIVSMLGQPGRIPSADFDVFRADATPLSPARLGHLIWLPALALVLVYVVWVWLPWALRSRRVAVTAYPATASILLLAAWLWAVQHGRFRTSLVLIALLWISLVVTLRRSASARSVGFVDRQVTQLSFALLMGWTTVMGACSIGIAARIWGRRPWGIPPETWWVVGVVVMLGVSMVLVRYLPGRLFIGATVAWGLTAIAYARIFGQPRMYGVAIASVVSASLIFVAAVAVLMWLRSRTKY